MRTLLLLAVPWLLAGMLAGCVPSRPPDAGAVVARDLAQLERLLEAPDRPRVIRLAPGVHRSRWPLRIRGVRDLRLEAEGAHLILESPDENVVEILDSERVTLIGLHARHARPSGPEGCLGTVIQIEDSRDVTIRDAELDGSGIVGVAAYDSPGLLIRDSHIHHNSAYPVVYQGPSLRLVGNRFEANGNGNRIAFSRRSDRWPPEHDIGADTALPGLHMRDNRFVGTGDR